MVMGDDYSVFDDSSLGVEEEELPKPEDLVAAKPEQKKDSLTPEGIDSYLYALESDDQDKRVDVDESTEQDLMGSIELPPQKPEEEYSVFNDPSLQVSPEQIKAQEDRFKRVTEPYDFPVFGEVFPQLRFRKDSPDVQFAPPMVYSADENPTVQQGLVLFTPYAGVNAMYEEFSLKHSSSDVNDKDKELDENNLAENIVATVFIDATSELAGRRVYDKLAEKIKAPEGSRDYRATIDSDLLTPPGVKPLTDREDYAEFAINRVIKNLFEANAPNSLITKVQKNYEMIKDDFDDVTAEDVLITGEGIRDRTARTYAQMGTLLLNTILTPVSLAVAAFAGKPRNPGEPHDNLSYLQSATENDTGILNREVNASRVKPAERIAARSYQPQPDPNKDIPGIEDSIKMTSSDILYMSQDSVRVPWQKGLLNHIKKRHKEILRARKFAVGRALLNKDQIVSMERIVDSKMPSVEQVYSFLKDFALYSYVDGLDSVYGEFLEGYSPVKPPPGGWAIEQALRESGRAQTKEFSDRMKRQGVSASALPSTTIERFFRYHDNLPKFVDSVNKERLKEEIKKGVLGEVAQKNPETAANVINAAQISPYRYNTVLKEFTRGFLKMMGPEETGKMALMALLGAKKYLGPSMLPFAEVDGAFSFDAISAEGLEGLGITDEEVEKIWEDMPGVMSIFIPGVLRGTRAAVSPIVKGAISLAKSAPSIKQTVNDPTMTPKQKVSEVGKIVGGEYDALETGVVREKSIPEKTAVVKVTADEAFPVVDTPTALKNAAKEARKKSQEVGLDDTSRRSLEQTAQAYEAAGRVVDDILLEKQKEAEAGDRTFSIMESITPTLDKVAQKTTSKPFEKAQAQVTARSKRVDSIKAELNAEQIKIKEKKAANKKYKPPGQRKLDSLIRDIAIDLGYYTDPGMTTSSSIRVNLKKFKADHLGEVHQRHSFARSLAEDGIVDPRVYRALMPELPVDGPNSISSFVLQAERSKLGFLKKAYNQEIQKVAEVRGVSVDKVKSEVNKLSVAEDMAANGVKDVNMYALLGLDDAQSKQYAAKGKSRPEMPYIRVKTRGEDMPYEGTVDASTEGMTAGKFASDIPYGLTRVALGRRPANIISNRLNQVKGKSAAKAMLPLLEASMLATLEFMKEPFAFTNFPSWMGDFVRYMYMNSTNSNSFSKSFGRVFQNFMSPSSILGEDLYAEVIRGQGKAEILEFKLRALARKLGVDEDSVAAKLDIDKSLQEVGLDQHSSGESVIRISPRGTLSGRFKEAVATALFAGEGAYVDLPDGSSTGKSRVYINEIFDIEYKTPDGKFVNAREATDTIAGYTLTIKENTKRINEINKELDDMTGPSARQAVAKEAAAQVLERSGLSPSRTLPDGSAYTGGLGTGRLGPNEAKTAALTQEKRNRIEMNSNLKKLIQDKKDEFGSAKNVFMVVDGEVKGVTDIRFNFKKDIDGVIGDAEKTLLGVLNTYVRPIQSEIMSLGANLAAGVKAYRMSVETTKIKNVVAVRTGDGSIKIVKKFKGDDAAEKAASYAQRINEDYQSKGNKGIIASVEADSAQSQKSTVVGKRDLELEGFDAVDKTAGYMSAYFSETAILDHMYSVFKKLEKGELTFDQMLQQDNMSATMVIASFPDNVVNKVKRDGMAPIDIARALLRKVEEGAIPAPSAKGSGRFFKERLWLNKEREFGLGFDMVKDFFSLYSESSQKAHSDLFKRVEHYRLLNSLRENGLILSKDEIAATPGISTSSPRFESMTRLSKEYPGLIDDVPDLFIERSVADGLIHQKNILDAVFEKSLPGELNVGGFLTKANRQLKRLAVISFLNGTMARNFTSGVLVQARMAKIPATMRYFKLALEANRAIKRGETPSDPLLLELSELLGGPGRGVRDLEMRRSGRSGQTLADAQADYMASILSGDESAAPMGVALDKITGERKAVTEPLVSVLDPDRPSAQRYGASINTSRLPGQERSSAQLKIQPLGEQLLGETKDFLSNISDEAVAVYGGIDATLRLAYAYEVAKHKGVNKNEAASLGRKVFFDHPDIPPIFQKLRDMPLLGFPFAGHLVWSTKAFGSYFQKNPFRAMVDGTLLTATTEATKSALKLGTVYESEVFDTDEDFDATLGLPMITATRSTQSERKALKRGDNPPREESLYSLGQAEIKLDPLFMGGQSDSTIKKAKRAYQEGSPSPGDLIAFGVGALQQQMAGDLLYSTGQEAGEPTPEEERITKRLTEATDPEDGGGFFGAISESLLSVLTFISSDARAIAKGISANSGTPFAGQDASKEAAYSNALGLAMKVKDLRAYKQNFNNVGQKKMKDLLDAVKVYGMTDGSLTDKKSKLKLKIKRDRALNAIRKIERADNIFKQKRAADGIRMRRQIVTLMRGMLKNRPETPEFEASYKNLLDYFYQEGYDTGQTNMLEN